MDQYTILYAEDDELIRNNISDILNLIFETVFIASNGQEALSLYEKKSPDIIILDINMPFLNGLEVAQKIRETNKHVPIVIATAYTDTKYFLQAVELNLTTYIIKPIMMTDLQKALKKCMSQLKSPKKNTIIIDDHTSYNIDTRTLYVDGNIVTLTNIEMKFFEYMLKYPNRVISYEEFEKNIWIEEVMTGGAIRSLVRDLRRLIGKSLIQNISKVGYKLVVKE